MAQLLQYFRFWAVISNTLQADAMVYAIESW